MARRPIAKPMRLGARVPTTNLAAPVLSLPTAMEAGNRERARLYRSRGWRKARDAFLTHNRTCCTPGCGHRSVIVDHRDGHQRDDWRLRFWDQSTWQPMCGTCHAAKSARELAAWRGAGEGIPGGRRYRPRSGQVRTTALGLLVRGPTDIKGPSNDQT
jgi:hypothetical protein